MKWEMPFDCGVSSREPDVYKRQVFMLRDMEHLNIQETAEALGITVASVKTRLLRARLMLRDLLAAGWEQGWFSRLPFEKGNKPW